MPMEYNFPVPNVRKLPEGHHPPPNAPMLPMRPLVHTSRAEEGSHSARLPDRGLHDILEKVDKLAMQV
jgi:hypothetical protein